MTCSRDCPTREKLTTEAWEWVESESSVSEPTPQRVRRESSSQTCAIKPMMLTQRTNRLPPKSNTTTKYITLSKILRSTPNFWRFWSFFGLNLECFQGFEKSLVQNLGVFGALLL
mmetsp:Transcript_11220/g.12313  ORF Transcript_11220/g.12313 Transcript_11220/m.12313 type:complete len:115 (-) Transcript_11220:59-403(-)